MLETIDLLQDTDFPPIKRQTLDTLQVNITYKCNQRCLHCHVNAGPTRTEMMDDAHLSLLLDVIKHNAIKTLDITGGAPEMHPRFKWLVEQASQLGVKVMDRCNLTILTEPGYEDMAAFLAKHQVEIIASLPCYSEANVDKQRGDGVFEKSIQALQQLNTLGYGKQDSGLILNLVYNPTGPSLPPNQQALEADYKVRLFDDFAIEFNQLFALTNMPIKRFGSTLISKGQFQDYMSLLKDNYQSANLKGVMCRSMVSVDYQGNVYDCDFNQQLAIDLAGKPHHLKDLLTQDLTQAQIAIADHCYGCTAGQGSSCGGAL